MRTDLYLRRPFAILSINPLIPTAIRQYVG
jgi:hypothetical protein